MRKQNLGHALRIEERAVELAEAEVERIRQLVDSNAASSASLDMSERELLRHQQSLQTQQSSLNLLPSQKDSLRAMLAAQQSQILEAKQHLAKTRLTAPFDCRVGNVSIDTGQFISLGQRLFVADGTAATEIVAQIPVDKTRTLINPGEVDMAELLSILASRDPNRIRDLFQLEVIVRASAGDLETSWDARFVTTSGEVDPRTRTVGFITVVDDPYGKIILGERPPLIRGVFCEVELRGRPIEARIVIPRQSIHNDTVYVLDQEERLERRSVEVEFVQSSLAVIRSGLSEGETLVVSDPTPAIDKQKVNPIPDSELLESIRAEAAGERPLR